MRAILTALLLGTAFIAAQTPAQPPTAQASAQPPPKANAIIRGHVTASDTNQPARRAQIRLNRTDGPRAGGPGANMTASTDADGNYEFTGVAPGRYMLSVTKNGYIPGSFGATQPNSPPRPIDVQEGRMIEHVDFALIRGSVITGRIFDETGEPISGVQVGVLRAIGNGDQRRLAPGGRMSSTDDLGSFRIFGLSPGEYVVQAQWRQNMPSSAEALGRTGYAPTYFPGVTDALSAQRFTLKANQNISDLVMALVPVATVRVSGSVVDSHGASVSSGSVMLWQSSNGPVMGSMGSASSPLRDGKFQFPGVAPGQYVLRKMPTNPTDGESASMDLSVGGDDIADLQLTTSPPLKISGRIVAEQADVPLVPPRLMLAPVAQGAVMFSDQSGQARGDLTFELKAPPGLYRLQTQTMPPPWAIRAVKVGGVDVTDTGIEVKPGRDVTGVELDVTTRTQTVNGSVSASADQIKDSAVIVFPGDAAKMKFPQRYVRVVRPGPEGRFTIGGLPPGDYNIIALEHFSPGPTPESDFLERQRPSATSFTLLEGETRTIDLRLTSVS